MAKQSATNLYIASDVERRVLGLLLTKPECVEEFAQFSPQTGEGSIFALKEHQLVYSALREMRELELPVDALTVAEYLKTKHNHVLEGNLVDMELEACTVPDLRGYSQALVERKMGRSLNEIVRQEMTAFEEYQDPLERMSRMRESLERAERLLPDTGTVSARVAVERAGQLMEAILNRPETMNMIRFGFLDLDRMTGPVMAGNLVVVAGKGKSGKTTLTLQTAGYNARAGRRGAIFGLEMGIEEMVLRMGFIDAKLSITHAFDGKMDSRELQAYTRAMVGLEQLPLYFNDSIFDFETLEVEATRLVRQQKVNFLVVDYIQLMEAPRAKRHESREQQVSSVSRGLKRLAKKLHIPIIALSQLNEESKVRESRAIEQDADKLIYINTEDEKRNTGGPPPTSKIVELKVIQRFGASGRFGDVQLYYDLEYGEFRNLASAGGEKEDPLDALPF